MRQDVSHQFCSSIGTLWNFILHILQGILASDAPFTKTRSRFKFKSRRVEFSRVPKKILIEGYVICWIGNLLTQLLESNGNSKSIKKNSTGTVGEYLGRAGIYQQALQPLSTKVIYCTKNIFPKFNKIPFSFYIPCY